MINDEENAISSAPLIAEGNGGWLKGYDEKYGREYYYNHLLGLSQWNRPDDYQEKNQDLENNRLSRSFQAVREYFEAQREEVIIERRKSGLALHLVSALRVPDSDDEFDDEDIPPSMTVGDKTPAPPPPPADTPTQLRAYDNWKRIVMRIIQQSSTWENVSYAIHIAAKSPPSLNHSDKFTLSQTPSHLMIAKNKALFLQDLLSSNRLFLSQVERNQEKLSNMEEELQQWTERRSVFADEKPYVAPTLLEFNGQYDVLGGMSTDLSSDRTSRIDSSRPRSFEETPSHPILKPLNKLINILNEFISTEKTFVNDMNKLLLLLAELKYSTVAGVRQFSSSAAFTGICFASETINITNSQFLESMTIASSLSPPLPSNSTSGNNVASKSYTDPNDCCEYALKFCDGVFLSLQRFAPFFRLFAQFIITHDSLSLLYSTLSFEDPDFSSILNQYENLLGESLLSLIIKPVQRLPRYVLLCKEIHHSLTKAYCVCQDLESNTTDDQAFVMKPEHSQLIKFLENKARDVHNQVAECAKQCNNSVRTHQDNLRLHQLYDMFREGGTNIPIVKNDRVIIKEGELKRHHRHNGIKSHEIQVFSDMLLSSSQAGKGLKLEQIFSLGKGSDTICLPIPSRGSGDPENTWFVLVSDDKTLFFGAKSHLEMLRWVEAIHECLIKNGADSDVYLMKNQIALVNTLIGEINRRSNDYLQKNREKNRQSVRIRSSSYDRSFVESTNSIQASWWHLLDILEEICEKEVQSEKDNENIGESETPGNNSNSVSHLRRVIEHHAKEAVGRMMLTITCLDEDKKGPNIIQSLLFNDTIRYIIAVGVFFEYPSTSSTSLSSSSMDFERPQLIKLFLLSDVLIGTYLNNVKDNLVYAFHINLQNLLCSDYRDGVSDYAILLNDTSKVTKRRLSIISRSTQVEYSKRILFASTIDMKFDWLSLMMQAVEGYNYYHHQSKEGSDNIKKASLRHPMETLKEIPLQRIGSDLLRCSWTTESKPTPPDMI